MELCIQMAIIFVGKQFMMSIVEYHLPKLWKLYNSLAFGKSFGSDKNSFPQWVRDFYLAEWGSDGLFWEYLEMGKLHVCFSVIQCLKSKQTVLHFFTDFEILNFDFEEFIIS